MDTSVTRPALAVRDIELGIVHPPSRLPTDEKKNDPIFQVEADAAVGTEPQGCQQKCWHGARPRDWSEYFVFPGGLVAIGFGVFHALQDTNEWVAAPSFAVGVICMLAGTRIRQLWITKTLDDEAQAFRQNNKTLRGKVVELNGITAQLGAENSALKKNIVTLGTDNTQIQQENQKFAAEIEAKGKLLVEMRAVSERLRKDVEALKVQGQQINTALRGEKDTTEHLEKISDLEQQLLALEKAEQEEAKRHARSMEQ